MIIADYHIYHHHIDSEMIQADHDFEDDVDDHDNEEIKRERKMVSDTITLISFERATIPGILSGCPSTGQYLRT